MDDFNAIEWREEQLRKANRRIEELRTLLAQWQTAFEDLFRQCLSNPIKNAWDQPVDVTKLNEVNATTTRILGE